MKKGESNWHTLEINNALNKLDTTAIGLSDEEANKRLEKYGLNELTQKDKTKVLFILLKQFKSWFVYILIIAAIISFILDHIIDFYVIIGVIIINAGIGFFQEFKAEKSISALKNMVVPYAKVYRNKHLEKIPAANLVPGDIILLEEGDRIPADARLIELKNLSVVESSLTGESVPSVKEVNTQRKNITIADRKNMIWLSTFIATGNCKAVVVSTGDDTALGEIAIDIQEIKLEDSHFQKKTDTLALQMGIIAISGAVLTFLIGYFIRGFEFLEILVFTIAALVSGIPEGLPAILAIVLAVGAFRMSKRNAIIRKLPATETLAIVNTIITDKTGTLTENSMTITNISLLNKAEIKVTGTGFKPEGIFTQNNSQINPQDNHSLNKLLHIAGICTKASLVKEKNDEDHYKIIGDPTEGALVVLAEKAGLRKQIIEDKETKIDDFQFDQELKYRACITQINNSNKRQLYVVGAPESVVEKCTKVIESKKSRKINQKDKEDIIKSINSMTGKAMRVLALAYTDVDINTNKVGKAENLIYIGLVGMIDPPKKGVKESIAKAKKSGIRVIMATGDHKNTALAIARDIGLNSKDSFTGEDLKKMNVEEFNKAIMETNVFARLTPHMKLKIAETLQKHGKVIAMTGDGVNDAPALKKADIGISMGRSGTDVARESSEIILVDDNFATIINAIEEGRIVYYNTRKASFFLITTNFAEHLAIISTLLLKMPLPLLPTQILLLNLATDTGPGIGLAVEPGHRNLNEEKPINKNNQILTFEIIPFILLMSTTMVLLAVFTFKYYLSQGIEIARTGVFAVMSFTQLFSAMTMRDLKRSYLNIGYKSNKTLNLMLILSLFLVAAVIYIPFFKTIFSFASISLLDFTILLILSSAVFWVGEAYKKFIKK